MAIYWLVWPTENLIYRFEIYEILDMVKKPNYLLTLFVRICGQYKEVLLFFENVRLCIN
ncbi:MAG: hypothetical protein SWX82_14660 [Cyanobacteriota bacterium]|nr:hypothetical protein [Cyanobacteriota bacterium]